MSRPIEDYALIGDLHTAALVSSAGSVDWLCLPRFDSPACFAALLGDDRHGHWRIGPAAPSGRVRRRYQPGTLVLETEFSTASGTIRLTDCMPPRSGDPVLLRMVEGISGSVELRMTLAARFEYGSAQPGISIRDGAYRIAAGPQALWLFGPLRLSRRGGVAVADFRVTEGDRVPLAAVWRPASNGAPARPPQPAELAENTARWWRDWVAALDCGEQRREAVTRSLITIKALTYAPTGGLVSAPTTSLPQRGSGARIGDSRYCWVTDAAAALDVLLHGGAVSEAGALIDWICRAVAGPLGRVQGQYGVAGERWLPEIELDWLPGYDGARPVRIGTAAAGQPQLAVYGEVMRARLAARMAGMAPHGDPWPDTELLDYLEARWRDPDPGRWEASGLPRQFTYSKLMTWAAADAAVQMIEKFADQGPAERWRRLRARIRADVLSLGYDSDGQKFVSRYAGCGTDASLLRMVELGFLPPADRRVRGTFAAVARELDQGGLLAACRPDPQDGPDVLPPGGTGYLPATFWLARGLAQMGREAEARRVFCGLLELRNDVGLLAGEYDPLRGRLGGNYPLAASHVALAAAAAALELADQPA